MAAGVEGAGVRGGSGVGVLSLLGGGEWGVGGGGGCVGVGGMGVGGGAGGVGVGAVAKILRVVVTTSLGK